METLTHPLLDEATVSQLRSTLLADETSWQDGRKTAGYQAAEVKNNLQLDRNSKIAKGNSQLVIEKLESDPLVKSFALPSHIHGVMFSRSGIGQGYGMHVDNAYMSSGRSDLSFTLFLSEPESYEGGGSVHSNLARQQASEAAGWPVDHLSQHKPACSGNSHCW